MPTACVCCGKPVVRLERRGRPANYCSVRCRRRLEKMRGRWDKRAAACADPSGFYALNRDMEFRTEEQRQYWQAELDRARADLGPRP
jgi:hypothetical protein